MNFLLLVFGTMLLAVVSFLATFFYIRDRNLRKGPPAEFRGWFQYNDGVQNRYIDPIEVVLLLEDHPEFRFDLTPRMAQRGEKMSIEVMIDAAKKAFGVVEFEDPKKPGLTKSEMLDLLDTFLKWAYFQKKNSEFWPGLALSMDAMSQDFENPITSSMLDFGSTEPEALESMP